METSGFTRKILSNDGVLYQLPPAEYLYSSFSSVEQIREIVKGIVNKVSSDFSVVVFERGNSGAWYNLKTA